MTDEPEKRPGKLTLAILAACALLALAALAGFRYFGPAAEAPLPLKPVVDPRLTAYQARCMDRITAHYAEMVQPLVKYAPGKGTLRVTVSIVADGHIRRIAINQSSGDLALDDAVVKMIQRVGRFDPVPAELALKQVELTLAFGFEPGKA